MAFGPRKVSWQDIGINTLGASIAWFIGSIIILLIIVSISSIISVPETFKNARLAGWVTNPMFPFILSFITFVAVIVTSLISAKLLQMTDGEKYKPRSEIYGQIGFLWILMYICLTPIYIYMWVQNYDYIMIVFIIHVLMFSFGSSLILELLNSYRYVLIWLYWNFLALFVSASITTLIFNSVWNGQAKLLILLLIIPIVFTLMTFIKGLFEYMYHAYYQITNLDGLWDIFYRIEQEEKELLKEEEEKNSI